MGCTFARDGHDAAALANLTAGEIAEQVWHARRLVGASGARNGVMMGMGEPLDNLGEVLPALRALTHQSMFDMRRAAVTVSTVGVPGAIKKLADEAPEINLALTSSRRRPHGSGRCGRNCCVRRRAKRSWKRWRRRCGTIARGRDAGR